jgi:hypothetical protein
MISLSLDRGIQLLVFIFSTDLELGCGLVRSWQELGIGSFSGNSSKLAKIVMDKNSYEFSSFFGHEMAPLVEGLH